MMSIIFKSERTCRPRILPIIVLKTNRLDCCRTRGWVSMNSNEVRVDVAWKKIGDGHSLRLWKMSTEIEAPPAELLNRVLRERHLWDSSLIKWRLVVRLDKKSEVVHYTCTSSVPASTRDFTILRSWRNDLPRGTCLVAETSIEHPDAPPVPAATRGIVLASRYLIQPCGAGKSRLVHLSRVDIKYVNHFFNHFFNIMCYCFYLIRFYYLFNIIDF